MFKSKYLGIAAVLFVSTMIVGCGDNKPPEMYPVKFHEGNLVTMKTDGRMGTVLSVSFCQKNDTDTHHSCNYHVRFPTGSVSTDTHLLSNDGSLKTAPYEEVLVYDYELAPAE